VVDKSLIPNLFLFYNIAIAKNYAQNDFSTRIWLRVGLKNDINHYGYKNIISIEAMYGLIISLVVSPAIIYNDYVWADSAFMQLLSVKPILLGLIIELGQILYLIVLSHQWEVICEII
jgi:hypothetical protein